ncbi:hypothetical protein Chor_012597 [Crotalus horridus]
MFAAGLGDITQQLNQSELAVLLNLLQSQTDLSVPQMAQLLNIHSNLEMQQHLEALNQSINALNEATTTQQLQDSQKVPEEETAAEEPSPPAGPSEDHATPEAASTQGDMQSILAVLLSQLIKTQEPATNTENSSEKNRDLWGPQKTPTLPQEETAACRHILPPEKRPPEPPGPPLLPPPNLTEENNSSAAQELNPAVTATLLQLLSQQETGLLSHPKQEPQVVRPSLEYTRSQTSSRTYTTVRRESCNLDVDERNFNQTITETSSSPMGKSRTFLGFTSHIRESSSYQSTGSIQFPGDQDLRFTQVPLGIHSAVGQSFIKTEGSNNTLVHSEAKIHNNEVGVTKAHLSDTGTSHTWGNPIQSTAYGKAFRGQNRVPPRGGRGVPY